jgi:putative colanic acid polymerase
MTTRDGRTRVLSLGSALAIIGLHFELARLGGLPVTVAPFTATIILRATTTLRVPPLAASLLCGVMGYALAIFLITPDGLTATEFFRSFSLLAFSAIVMLSAVTLPLRGSGDWLAMSARIVLRIVAPFSTAQFLLYEFLANPALYNPWREHQYLYPYDVASQFGVTRAQGFYLEPSFNAFVLTAVFAILMLRRRIGMSDYVLLCIGLLTTRSLIGLLISFTLLFLLLAGPRFAHRPYLRPLVLGLLPIFMWGALAYIVNRIETVSIVGSSAHYRIIAPLNMITDVLRTRYFGMPLGSVDHVYRTYGVLNGSEVGNSLDNGLYVVIFYFGWPGLIALLAGALTITLFLLRQPSSRAITAMLFVFCSLVFSGGIFLPDYQFIIALVVLAARYPLLAEPSSPVPAVSRSLEPVSS